MKWVTRAAGAAWRRCHGLHGRVPPPSTGAPGSCHSGHIWEGMTEGPRKAEGGLSVLLSRLERHQPVPCLVNKPTTPHPPQSRDRMMSSLGLALTTSHPAAVGRVGTPSGFSKPQASCHSRPRAPLELPRAPSPADCRLLRAGSHLHRRRSGPAHAWEQPGLSVHCRGCSTAWVASEQQRFVVLGPTRQALVSVPFRTPLLASCCVFAWPARWLPPGDPSTPGPHLLRPPHWD